MRALEKLGAYDDGRWWQLDEQVVAQPSLPMVPWKKGAPRRLSLVNGQPEPPSLKLSLTPSP